MGAKKKVRLLRSRATSLPVSSCSERFSAKNVERSRFRWEEVKKCVRTGSAAASCLVSCPISAVAVDFLDDSRRRTHTVVSLFKLEIFCFLLFLFCIIEPGRPHSASFRRRTYALRACYLPATRFRALIYPATEQASLSWKLQRARLVAARSVRVRSVRPSQPPAFRASWAHDVLAELSVCLFFSTLAKFSCVFINCVWVCAIHGSFKPDALHIKPTDNFSVCFSFFKLSPAKETVLLGLLFRFSIH